MNANLKISRETLSRLHDAELHEIMIDTKKKGLILSFISEDNIRYAFQFHDVLFQRINGVLGQNVVSRAIISNISNIDANEMEALAKWTSSIGDNNRPLDAALFAKHVSDIAAGDTVLSFLVQARTALAQR